ncbi:PREDICTED: uncharacterized protein LOC104590587 isoform X1 [Nelumbo nucifera]|uniref:Uncharacterized protein LOC104590587 isoform X1 n=1 Tax=Nelumbo nucifera TaxID=4432 RepID=A0A1U7Z366_NELNU|nr:PREDICTED: uncharacterized protein LOC104590587 isoform X1 [Nelumbo nucifera]XP_010247612.1 PREDICTED: uncharacterized protein LOC104590587 isoform X1 [Nelumbo nucifera]XP_010247621.1 PREDICTED: uncharacterized protein LOC104590587 isoform X1 [Nelumbo nucifera]XP_010247626.1 PREDICTED: uncharacterized protein LOC104590587 isoform X1 [Nelumbo nucifera]XP_019052066.1 PREDICTED: uncharacterized protein LOC104590587 isoform X1 [Nelumbo nucifera]XP_019052068.1 PREDICTED: uncharacterized protein 
MSSQALESSSQATSIAAKDDVLSQVLGEERCGHVHGLGLGPTPTSLWGPTTKHQNTQLVAENKELKEKINSLTGKYNDLDEKLKKVLEMLHNRGEGSTNATFINSPESMHSSEASHMVENLGLVDDEVLNKTCVADDANFETMPTTNSLDDVHTTTPVVGAAIHLIAEQTNNLVKLLDLDDEVVAYALLKSKDPTKEVQGRPLGDKWSEVLVRLSTKDDAPLMRIDAGRRTIKDAAAATQTIAWRNDFIKSDFRPH